MKILVCLALALLVAEHCCEAGVRERRRIRPGLIQHHIDPPESWVWKPKTTPEPRGLDDFVEKDEVIDASEDDYSEDDVEPSRGPVSRDLDPEDEDKALEAFFGAGYSVPSSDNIVNGQPIPITYAPHQIQLVFRGRQTICGGSIIHEKWVLTAAHCLHGLIDKGKFHILTGSQKREQGIRSEIAQFKIHKEYNPSNHQNDIALIELKKPLDLKNNPNQKAIPLAGVPPKAGVDVFVSGFGTQVSGAQQGSPVLEGTVVPAVSNLKCGLGYLTRGIIVRDGMFCAGDGVHDTCQGDSGGPAVVDDQLMGVTSFGIGCGSKFYPGIYTLVPAYLGWIKQETGLQIGPKGIHGRDEDGNEIPDLVVEESKDSIVGGKISKITKAPWQIQLQEDKFTICGGSIIDKEWILTAAHCLYKKPGEKSGVLEITTGSMFRNLGTRYQVEKTIIHDKYNPRTMVNDIALIKLASPISFNKNQNKISLAREVPVEGDLFLSGYGTVGSEKRISYALRTATSPLMSNDECNEKYREIPSINIKEGMFCAGNGKTDTCQGDSGGPAVCGEDQLCGVVSFGLGCADPRYPGVYTSVPKYHRWIVIKTGLKTL